MIDIVDDYSYAQGYGLFCGKKCVAKKQAEGIAPKRGKKNKAEWAAKQASEAAAYQAAATQSANKKSKAPLVIGVVLVLGIVATIVIVKMRKK